MVTGKSQYKVTHVVQQKFISLYFHISQNYKIVIKLPVLNNQGSKTTCVQNEKFKHITFNHIPDKSYNFISQNDIFLPCSLHATERAHFFIIPTANKSNQILTLNAIQTFHSICKRAND